MAEHLEVEWYKEPTDVVVVGSGCAGVMAAIKARQAGARVMLLTKGPFSCGCSSIAVGGIAAPLGHDDPRDNPEVLYQDIVAFEPGLCDQNLVWTVCEEINDLVRELDSWGTKFIKVGDKFQQKFTMGQTYARIVHHMDTTGSVLMKSMSKKLAGMDVTILSHTMVTDILVQDGATRGVLALDYKQGKLIVVPAPSVILATGGAGQAYLYNDNPSVVTGDGYALAYRAGAELMDLEFVGFMLCACYPGKLRWASSYASTSAFVMFGARFYNRLGERFMYKYYPESGDIQRSRARMVQAAAREIMEGRGSPHGGVFLDCSDSIAKMREFAPAGCDFFDRAGIDLRYQPQEIAPFAHTFQGGVRIDGFGQTQVPGLFAVGETAGGVLGGERLGGIPLAEAAVFGARSGRHAAARSNGIGDRGLDEELVNPHLAAIRALCERSDGAPGSQVRQEITGLLNEVAGPVRTEESLQKGLRRLDEMAHTVVPRICVDASQSSSRWSGKLRETFETLNMFEVARAVMRLAESRKESRGFHYRIDFPEQDDAHFRKNGIMSKNSDTVLYHDPPVRSARPDRLIGDEEV